MARRAGLLRPAAVRLLLPAPWDHVVRVLLSFALAQYVAYWLQLDSPFSAATTVLVLASPVRGAILSKSLYRLLGTVAGTIFAIVLIALFSQDPVLLILGFAVWLGVCTALATVLRHFRSYGAVLAGYTVSLIAFSAQNDPTRIFDIALSRVSVVTIGIAASAVVSMVLQPATGRRALQARLNGQIAAVARLAAEALAGKPMPELRLGRSRAAAAMGGLDQAIEFAAAEDYDISRQAPALRQSVAELFGALTSSTLVGPGLAALVLRDGPDSIAGQAAALGSAMLARLQAPPVADEAATAALLDATEHCRAELLALENGAPLDVITVLHQARDLLHQLAASIDGAALRPGRPVAVPERLRPVIYPATAIRNGLRAALAVTLGGAFWLYSAWPSGAMMMAILGPVCALLGTLDSAAAASVEFFKGIVASVIVAYVVEFALLPQITGFPLLMAVMLPFIAVGTWLTSKPKFALSAMGFLIFFNTLVGAANPMVFDEPGFLNVGFAFIVSGFCGVLTFRIILPPNFARDVRQMAAAVLRDTQRLARSRALPAWLPWEHRQHQRVVRIASRLPADPARRAPVLDGVTALLMVGREVLQLRRALAERPLQPVPRAVVAEGLAHLRRLSADPQGAAIASAQAAEALLRHGQAMAEDGQPIPDHPGDLDCRHVAAAFHNIHQQLTRHLEFLALAGATLPPARPAAPAPAPVLEHAA